VVTRRLYLNDSNNNSFDTLHCLEARVLSNLHTGTGRTVGKLSPAGVTSVRGALGKLLVHPLSSAFISLTYD